MMLPRRIIGVFIGGLQIIGIICHRVKKGDLIVFPENPGQISSLDEA